MRGHVEDGGTVQLALLGECGGRGDAGDDGFRGGTHATRLRDVVRRFECEPEIAQTEGGTGAAERGHHEMRFVTRQRVFAFAAIQRIVVCTAQ